MRWLLLSLKMIGKRWTWSAMLSHKGASGSPINLL